MHKLNLKNVEIELENEMLSDEEILNYLMYLEEKNGKRKLSRVKIKVDGEYVDLSYDLQPLKFERIRRITGYLVGTLDRFNDAKMVEVEARVKHNMSE